MIEAKLIKSTVEFKRHDKQKEDGSNELRDSSVYSTQLNVYLNIFGIPSGLLIIGFNNRIMSSNRSSALLTRSKWILLFLFTL